MRLVLLTFLIALVGCSHSVHLVNISDSTPGRNPKQGKSLEVIKEQKVIMGFVFDTNYVDEARSELMSKCPGTIENITTRYSTSHGFFSWTNKIYLQAKCYL